MLEVTDFHKQYGDVTAVTESSFSVSSGEVFGLVGPNGAGKTTTLKAVVGLIEPTRGTISVGGESPINPGVRRQIGWLPEDTALYDDMTPQSYLEFFADLYDVPDEDAQTRIADTLDRLALSTRDRRLSDCSKGMRRKVAMARALINDPSLVVFDEPASGLDPLTTREVVSVTRDLADQGKTVLFSAHDLHHVEEVCDRVAVMHNGRIAAHGTLADIQADHGRTTYTVYTSVPIDGSHPEDDRHRIDIEDIDSLETIRERVTAAGGKIVDVRSRESSLEDVFVTITG